ncbi:hypothetical protein [Micrococcus sp.]|uniref:hypothetical protein n=1 Tax=Micrococcus sp. TaxID=1271 RepID=UPI002A917C38|nr:hypothetical protein [Micrococcus sp.]MDY6054935.1 hypothetical protein [Micrococcus sp.]
MSAPRTVALLVTRMVLLTALCGLALGVAGALSTQRQQHFSAADCADAVWEVGIAVADPALTGLWQTAETALAGRDLTLMATGADPGLHHVSGPAAGCLTGVDPARLADLREDGGLLIRAGGALADRAQEDGAVAGHPALVVPEAQWRGLPSDAVIQPRPAFDDVPAYTGFLAGDPADLDDAVQAMRSAGAEVEVAAVPSALTAALSSPVLGTAAVLTGLTAVSVTAFWVLTLRSQERPRLRVLRLLGVPPARAAASRWATSALPFAGAALAAAALWLGMSLSGTLPSPAPGEAAAVVAGVIVVDALLVAGTHLAALRVREVPR